MTEHSFDLTRLGNIEAVEREVYGGPAPYRPYAAGRGRVPPFLPIGDDHHQVRMTASTHDPWGILRHSSEEALDNTRRLPEKVKALAPALYHLDEDEGADTLIVTYGITSGAAREAVMTLREEGGAVSLLVARTLVPIPDAYHEILSRYAHVVFAEENLQGQFASLLFGDRLPGGVGAAANIGHMVEPEQILREVRR